MHKIDFKILDLSYYLTEKRYSQTFWWFMLTAKFFFIESNKKKKIHKAKGSFKILSFKSLDMREKVLIALVYLFYSWKKTCKKRLNWDKTKNNKDYKLHSLCIKLLRQPFFAYNEQILKGEASCSRCFILVCMLSWFCAFMYKIFLKCLSFR